MKLKLCLKHCSLLIAGMLMLKLKITSHGKEWLIWTGSLIKPVHVAIFKAKIPSFSSKRGHVTEKHVLTGRKHDVLGNQTFEVRRLLSKLSHQSWKAFDVFDKQILLKL